MSKSEYYLPLFLVIWNQEIWALAPNTPSLLLSLPLNLLMPSFHNRRLHFCRFSNGAHHYLSFHLHQPFVTNIFTTTTTPHPFLKNFKWVSLRLWIGMAGDFDWVVLESREFIYLFLFYFIFGYVDSIRISSGFWVLSNIGLETWRRTIDRKSTRLNSSH